MARFVDDESKSKRGGQGMDISDWPRFTYANVPRQLNLVDCGEYSQDSGHASLDNENELPSKSS